MAHRAARRGSYCIHLNGGSISAIDVLYVFQLRFLNLIVHNITVLALVRIRNRFASGVLLVFIRLHDNLFELLGFVALGRKPLFRLARNSPYAAPH
jgi:hypothetical protein